MTAKHSVLFVCLGNICRSTMAEGVFEHLVIDSAGTGDWYVGYPPDERTMKVLKKHGIHGYKHKGRLITQADFTTFEYVFGMNHEIISDITELALANSTAKVALLGEFDPQKELIIEDPYFTVLPPLSKPHGCFFFCVAFLAHHWKKKKNIYKVHPSAKVCM
ncbi:unnamed protein product [Candidula unifasciata]|uniref:Phosphotyrosine protein phosphatase I domain-containing protein n=1 Tax=Candidula unifasciata TaxID=100452 RepID=A0A8S3ZTB3_9EUPU|nr:unnamed protein product [Candidula unifasciata]